MEIRRYINVIRRWWWLALVGFLVVTVAGFAFSYIQQPKYQASLTLIVNPKASITDVDVVRQSLETLSNADVINTYGEIARSRKIYEQAFSNVGLKMDPKNPIDLQVTVISNTNLIRLDVLGESPTAVYKIVNAIADNSVDYVEKLDEVYEMKVIDRPVVPTQPYSPDIFRDTILSAGLGILLGISATFFAEYMRNPMELLENFSILDRDTGLYNKRYFLQRLREEISRSKRAKQSMAFCIIHINSIDNPVDIYPQETMQLIYRRFMTHLKKAVRQGEFLARWDTNRVAWFLYDTSEDTIQLAFDRLSKVIEDKILEDEETGIKFAFSASFGATVYAPTMTENEFIALTDQASKQADLDSGHHYRVVSSKETSAKMPLVPSN
jgi:diguanylate cyclase (GGDEF)-like protein